MASHHIPFLILIPDSKSLGSKISNGSTPV